MIPSSLSICHARAAVDMGPINCTKAIFEKWVALGIVLNFRWNRFIFTRQFDMIVIKWSRRKEVEDLEKISVIQWADQQ